MHCGACSNDLQWHGWAPEATCVANALHVAEVDHSDDEQASFKLNLIRRILRKKKYEHMKKQERKPFYSTDHHDVLEENFAWPLLKKTLTI